ncbi:putative ABC transporter ATP-binding protein/permease [Pseudocercospora fuligena]|uniref:Putative ABC transporter ATP-binding protein/permease n=1 Tax=Pseudocercospora fuligena TaxID=685502 RepID=A0A8H6RJ91_9PEZI|nr:putative ABC transporter ATP-binding protein/permease [Pseudocercospora fuligena]
MLKILKDVTLDLSGPGLTAIVGHSGSGKTTLLDALCGRSNLAGLETVGITNLACHNVSDSRSLHANDIAYAEQRDHLLPLLTVEETLKYAAALRLPHKSIEEQEAEVERVLQLLHLDGCRTTRLGNENTGGCSGGERRRVSIGVQLLQDVPILFLDEPTTGLDAKAALEVVKVLREMAEAGKAVVMTETNRAPVHQPRSEVRSLVDRCVIMSDGAVLYSGSTAKCLAHLDAIGCPAPEHENPFDFIMDLLGAGEFRPSVKADPRSAPEDHSSLTTHVQGLVRPQECAPTARTESKDWLHAFSRLRTHCGRAWKVTTRDHLGVLAGQLEAVFMGLACGLIFFHLGRDEAGIRSRQGALYVACTIQPYITSVCEAYRLCDNIDFYERERRDGVVGPWTYYTSRRLVRLALDDVLVPLIFVALFYPLSGLEKGAGHFFVFFAVQFLLHLASVNLATICTSFVRDFLAASLVANLVLVTNFLTAGFLINTRHLPVWLQWTRWVSFVVSCQLHNFEEIMLIVAKALRLQCARKQ